MKRYEDYIDRREYYDNLRWMEFAKDVIIELDINHKALIKLGEMFKDIIEKLERLDARLAKLEEARDKP